MDNNLQICSIYPTMVEMKDGTTRHIDWTSDSICRAVEEYCGQDFGYMFRQLFESMQEELLDLESELALYQSEEDEYEK